MNCSTHPHNKKAYVYVVMGARRNKQKWNMSYINDNKDLLWTMWFPPLDFKNVYDLVWKFVGGNCFNLVVREITIRLHNNNIVWNLINQWHTMAQRNGRAQILIFKHLLFALRLTIHTFWFFMSICVHVWCMLNNTWLL